MALITEEEALHLLRAKINYKTNIKTLAESYGVSAAFMSRQLAGNEPITLEILKSLNIEKRVEFHIIRPSTPPPTNKEIDDGVRVKLDAECP